MIGFRGRKLRPRVGTVGASTGQACQQALVGRRVHSSIQVGLVSFWTRIIHNRPAALLPAFLQPAVRRALGMGCAERSPAQ